MTGKQLQWLYKTLTTKNSFQMKFEFALWTRSMVRELLRKRFGARLIEVSVGRVLKKMGLSPQQPLRRAYEQDPDRVQRWLDHEFPKIKQLANHRGKLQLFFLPQSGGGSRKCSQGAACNVT